MPTVYGYLDLLKNELRNAAVQNLASAPSSPVKGQLYFNSTGGDNTLYWWDGTVWQQAKGTSGGGSTMSNSASTLVVGGTASGGASTDSSRGDHVHALPGWGTSTAQTAFGGARADGVATTFARSDHTHGTPAHDAAAHSAIPLNTYAAPTGSLNLNSQKISSLADGTVATDAVNLGQLQNSVAGLSWKAAVRAATTANITLSGVQTIDGVSVIANDRVLVKNQTTTSANGIYLAASGAWTRTTDADSSPELVNASVYVAEGTTQADTAWTQTTNAPITVGTTTLVFTQFSGAGTYSAGAGLAQSGNAFNVGTGTGITVTADAIAVDTSVIATVASLTGMVKKYAAALTGTASPETVTHNLNSRDVQVQVYNGASPYTAVDVDWDATTVNTVVIRYSPVLGAGYRCVVMG